ncbi:MAG: metal ABC transporter permease [Rhodospirillaceae bacterium]|nr:metal ABC transporter permease [Rhodospirillaceae bacterium]
MDNFILRALVAGIGIALIAGPLGCFIVWRRMAYFGDTLSHAALLGVAAGFALGVSPIAGVIMTCIAIGAVLLGVQSQSRVPTDTLLGILSHTALSFGLIALSFMDTVRVDLMGYLFGDILAVTTADIAWIYAGAVVILSGLLMIWRPLVALTIHADLAVAEGVPAHRIRIIFMLLIALTVALAMKIVGVLLISALLLIPTAAARRCASSPEQMALATVGLGVFAVTGGLYASLMWDLPSGPGIVAAATVIFVLSLLVGPRAFRSS